MIGSGAKLELLKLIFGNWYLPALIAAVILERAYNSFHKFERKIAPLKRALAEAVSEVKSCNSPSQFTEKYEEISENFGSNKFIGTIWNEYKSTLILPFDAPIIRNTLRPSAFFNDDIYFKCGVSLREFEAVPNQLVGAGLIFTFLGLVISLVFAQQGLGGDAAAATKSLKELLGAASFKFTTSLAALFSSVLYVWRKNKLLHEVDVLLEELCRELERVMEQVTAEGLAEESRRELVNQSGQLERFNSEFATSIADALESKLQKGLADAMSPVAAQIENLAQRLGEINQDALEQMVKQFSHELGGAAKEHTQALAEMLKAAAESISNVPDKIDEASGRFGEMVRAGAEEITISMAAAAENMDAALEVSTAALEKNIQSAALQLGKAADAIEESRGKQEAFTGSLKEAEEVILRRLENVVFAVQKASEQFQGLSQQIEATLSSSQGANGLVLKIADAATALSSAASKIEHVGRQTEAANQNGQAVLASLTSRTEAIEGATRSLNAAMAAAFEKVSGGVGKFGEVTGQFVGEMDKNLAICVNHLSSAVQQLDEAIESLPKRTDYAELAKAIGSVRLRAGAP